SNALQKTQWARYTIFDLQDNGGGLLTQCFAIIGDLVPTGSAIIRFHERKVDSITLAAFTHDTIYYSDGAGQFRNRTLVLLVDSNTASASEVTVSCLKQVYPAIKIIGTHTYGKARAQIMSGTPNNGLAKVTCALISPLSGPSYDLVGIKPDTTIAAGQSALDLAESIIDNTAPAKKRARIARFDSGIRLLKQQFARNSKQSALIDNRKPQKYYPNKSFSSPKD
ncbi:MAG: S41 family peptidase, partial [Chitinivibrionales bacterium]|nr:S41 family peptidase [Chitinivibrionales bacterium]